ncbi:bleomycin resistance protein [Microbacterium sp. W4I20]|uniref:bleomycin resistance protein n=1 Tax=Microbacterium sp. W4I20 TaxID=3042262 RepID=UPI002782BC7C|nr:bleomycin resistance protein [Microbacterium sp. W4I20]MDQ0726859.1 catechol 2,3-dioxygenase-like lactoylglutathione lyase family enzyme [Microbacterium sp. W4I20]
MTADRALPNLPASDFAVTRRFYESFGFRTTFSDDGWMILRRGTVELEFFSHPDVDPLSSAHQCTIRVADLDELWLAIRATGVPVADTGHPRLHEPRMQDWGMRAGYLIDPDGTQLTLIENPR